MRTNKPRMDYGLSYRPKVKQNSRLPQQRTPPKWEPKYVPPKPTRWEQIGQRAEQALPNYQLGVFPQTVQNIQQSMPTQQPTPQYPPGLWQYQNYFNVNPPPTVGPSPQQAAQMYQPQLRNLLTRPIRYGIGYGPGSVYNVGIGAYDQSVAQMGLKPRYSTLNPKRVDAWGFDPYEVGGSPYMTSAYTPTYAPTSGGYGGYGGGGGYKYSSTPSIGGETARRQQFYNTMVQWLIS